MENKTVAVAQLVYTFRDISDIEKDVEIKDFENLQMFINGNDSEKTLKDMFVKISSNGDDYLKGFSILGSIDQVEEDCNITFKDPADNKEYSFTVKEPSMIQAADILITEEDDAKYTKILEDTILKSEEIESDEEQEKENESAGDDETLADSEVSVEATHAPSVAVETKPAPALALVNQEYENQKNDFIEKGYKEFSNNKNPNEKVLYNTIKDDCIFILIKDENEFEPVSIKKNDFNDFELPDGRKFSLGRGNKIIYEISESEDSVLSKN